ncbi:MAG TPA: mechanosensitive ion channel domain-containing protein [Amnibacterium sp.]|uniref:mechanosensitive ion channel family protein n=1 Tax=Amnibacterium sp. TaxID=1872496 RepID=UPI002F9558A8
MTDGLSAVLQSATTQAVKSDWEAFWASTWGDVLWHVIQIVLIVIVALLVRLIAHRIVGVFVERVVSGVKRRQRAQDTQALLASPVAAARLVARTRTLGSVLNNLVSAVVVIVAILYIVTVINAQITAAFSLITAALGAGLGFGAQNIVKDVLTGLFMVADDQLGVGDIVNTDLASGVVEAVGIRVTQIRDANGVLWYVRNGELTRVGNLSQGWSRAIVDVTVPKDVDVDAVQERMLATATQVLSDPQWAPYIAEKPELWGIESVTPDGVVLRLVVRTRVNTRDDVAWSLRVHLHEALVAGGVQAASISSAPLDRFELAGALRGVRPPSTGPVSRRTPRTRPPRAADPAAQQAAALQSAPPQPTAPTVRPRSGARGASGAHGASGTSGPAAPSDGSDGR